MATADDDNLKVFYRTMTTEQLMTYRSALGHDMVAVGARKPSTVAFCEHRRRLVAEILGERGVEALN